MENKPAASENTDYSALLYRANTGLSGTKPGGSEVVEEHKERISESKKLICIIFVACHPSLD